MAGLRFEDLRPDDNLEQLAAGIAQAIGFDPPEVKSSLQPPQLRITKGRGQGIKSYTVVARSVPVIFLGEDLYPVIRQYCRAAATFFLPNEIGGPRPSDLWPKARSALATTVDWYTSPAKRPRLPDFKATPRQEGAGSAMADSAYRFVLCHEMAHVALGHLQTGYLDPNADSANNVEVLRASQERELEADQLGLELQVRSLPSELAVAALAGAMYYIYFIRLFDDIRLQLLSKLVDFQAWHIEYSHPPYLRRVLGLMSTAHGLIGKFASDGIDALRGDLENLTGELIQASEEGQDQIAANASRLLADRSRSGNATEALLKMLEQSPLGVLRALDGTTSVPHLADQVLECLPAEFREFLHQTQAERSRQLA